MTKTIDTYDTILRYDFVCLRYTLTTRVAITMTRYDYTAVRHSWTSLAKLHFAGHNFDNAAVATPNCPSTEPAAKISAIQLRPRRGDEGRKRSSWSSKNSGSFQAVCVTISIRR